MPEGAGAPLLLPSSCGTAGEGAKETNRRGSPARGKAEGATQNSPRPDPRRSCRKRATGDRRKDGETDFLLAGERGQSALSPLKQNNEHTRRRRSRSQFALRFDRLKGAAAGGLSIAPPEGRKPGPAFGKPYGATWRARVAFGCSAPEGRSGRLPARAGAENASCMSRTQRGR